jgi:hypothetical protein
MSSVSHNPFHSPEFPDPIVRAIAAGNSLLTGIRWVRQEGPTHAAALAFYARAFILSLDPAQFPGRVGTDLLELRQAVLDATKGSCLKWKARPIRKALDRFMKAAGSPEASKQADRLQVAVEDPLYAQLRADRAVASAALAEEALRAAQAASAALGEQPPQAGQETPTKDEPPPTAGQETSAALGEPPPAGQEASAKDEPVPPPASEEQALPLWDREERELWYNGVLCRRFKREATNQFAVLDAFQKDGWPERIVRFSEEDQTVIDLNKGLIAGSPIRFRQTRRHIRWHVVPSPSA